MRVAHSTSGNVFVCHEQLERVFRSDALISCFVDRKFINSSCIESVCEAYSYYTSRCTVDELSSISQKNVYQSLLNSGDPFDVVSYLKRKLDMRFEIDDVISFDEDTVCSLVQSYRVCSKKFGFAVTFSHVRAVCNHWCTKSRFGNKSAGCAFGCGHPNDRIAHTLICPKFWELLFSFTHTDLIDLDLFDVLLLFHHYDNSFASLRSIVLIGTHMCFLFYHACRHGKTFDRRLLQHHLSHYCRSHRNVAKAIRESFPIP